MTNIAKISFGELQRLVQTLHGAGFTEEDAIRIIKQPSLADTMLASIRPGIVASVSPQFYPARDYTRYNQYLHSVSDQFDFLRDINRRLPRDLQIPAVWFDLDISAASGHVQSVEHLKTLHVEHDTVAKRLAVAQELVRLTQPAIYDSEFARDADSLRLNRTARRYATTGLYLVGVNLVDNWDPEKGRNIDQVRTRGQELAATEAIEAYALQAPELYQSQDGENLPYFDCAGLEQVARFAQVPYSDWNRFNRLVYFDAYRSDNVSRNYSAPSLVA